MGVEDLLAGEDDLHRTAGDQRHLGGDELMGEDVGLPAETAAVETGRHPDLGFFHLQDLGEETVQVVGDLGGGVDVEAAVVADEGHRPVGLQGGVVGALVEEDVLADVVGYFEAELHVAELQGHLSVTVVGWSFTVDRIVDDL